MAVVAFRPPADSSEGHELGREQEDPYLALRERARGVKLEACREVAHSRALKQMLEERGGGRSTSRCAWCGRYRLDGEWVSVHDPAFGHGERPTHVLCEDCTDAPREAGSKPVGG
jgi:hypothetical protein